MSSLPATSETATRVKRENDSSDNPDSSGWSASLYNKTASFVYSASFIAPVMNLLDAQPGEQILDLGCGSGEVSLEIERIVQMARKNGLRHAFIGDAQELQLPQEYASLAGQFDAVFSNATLHWCKRDPLGVLIGARKTLKPGGRLVAEMGGFMNCIGVRGAIHGALRRRGYDPKVVDPWYFPSIEDYVKLLVTAGFVPTQMSLTPRITPLPTGLMEWLRLFVRSSFLKAFSDEQAEEIMKEVVDHCRVDCQDEGGNWALTYMRLRFSALVKDP
ncbi:cyclopropane-fatty-acyl-phospholipid synthase [Coprinopsis cinerea okayama7|uniref:Cyclopropane-fatty-acyl-phospholipid synthase n=1 Tax=Coprinopsis cinerea (strain Okayama-7 / 130 / ATCC MYA-4618 / FGSC 9003) TaxID=240176 RepID=A8NRW0_COPC7|nr:cyclopropane-fatty-acyl-phospholipid synthase [Coprinopsis cinerea okayama7\|eukprot:XP_001835869.2 cyclopropane-fatty-acyl-phospholipid synthase [Coprinopsis cinerea okayama7\